MKMKTYKVTVPLRAQRYKFNSEEEIKLVFRKIDKCIDVLTDEILDNKSDIELNLIEYFESVDDTDNILNIVVETDLDLVNLATLEDRIMCWGSLATCENNFNNIKDTMWFYFEEFKQGIQTDRKKYKRLTVEEMKND